MIQFFKNIGPTELIIIGIVLVVLFGGKRLSSFARGFGESGRELKKVKKEMNEAYDDFKNMDTEDKKGGG